jgi:hypothetical protein
MYSQDTIDQFIELRSEGKSYRTIAAQLKICVGTAAKWGRDHKAEIARRHGFRIEALHERYLGSYEDKLADMTAEIAQINAELKQRDLETVSTEFLLYRKTCLQARLDKLAASALRVDDVDSESEPPTQN